MRKVIFATHGRMCEGMLDTLSIFGFEGEDLCAIPFYVEGYDSENELERIIQEAGNDAVLLLTDVAFGSVNQAVMAKYADRENIHIVSGVNLMVALELLSIPEEDINEETVRAHVNNCRESIVYTRDIKTNINEDDE